ncbi:UbiA-like protein EboC [Flectobacillus major]|uniref:UbiA-like protein EboC n=1 Tax=Flectobacillus major TaxID=103 RepID=UPI0021CDA9C1|nr:UbiA-like protein EboC [Flectobacillus major]
MDIKSYLQLMRPANLVTAVADIMAGMAISGFLFEINFSCFQTVLILSMSTIGLYGGGVVFNDVFDAKLDAIERPERAIPSGRVTLMEATILALVLLVVGILLAGLISFQSAMIALSVALLAVIYDRFGKHNAILGPINMGLCRGGNLLLGISVLPNAVEQWWYLGIIPVVYIAAVTMVSRGEVHGGNPKTLYFAGFLYVSVSICQVFFAYQLGNLWLTVALVITHLYMIFRPLLVAIQNPIGPNIGKAVKAGVISLIIMDAAWVGVAGNWAVALVVVLLLPISIRLAKIFAVT